MMHLDRPTLAYHF